jgi:hypothetical protein
VWQGLSQCGADTFSRRVLCRFESYDVLESNILQTGTTLLGVQAVQDTGAP